MQKDATTTIHARNPPSGTVELMVISSIPGFISITIASIVVPLKLTFSTCSVEVWVFVILIKSSFHTNMKVVAQLNTLRKLISFE